MNAGAAHRFLVPGLVFMGMVVAVVSSLGAPLIPTVAASYHISLSDAQWMLTIVFLVSAVATPVMGRLSDGPRRKATILAGLTVVAVGGILAALPLGFGALLAGRACQGVGLGLTPLAITVARDALPAERSRPAVALLSITTVAGVGLGYPITALIAEYGGLHAAFWFGAGVAAASLAVAAVVVPSSAGRPASHLDLPGAAMLGAGLAGLLLALSEGQDWGWGSPLLVVVAAGSLAVLAGWALVELRHSHPLVELRLLRGAAVLTADVTGVLAGVGMYLMLSGVTRLVQTPASSGYGLGGSIAVAGLMLTPFSAGSVAASSLTRVLLRRLPAGHILPLGAAVVLAGAAMLAFARGSLWEIAVAMAVAGLGVGGVFGVMPGLIVGSVPSRETGSALSFNQVLRYTGYSIGSVLSAVVLQAATAPGHALPAAGGYTTSGLVACGVWAATAATALLLRWMLPEWAAEPGREVAQLENAEQDELESVADALRSEEGQRPGEAG